MKFTQALVKTRKEAPADETAKNAQLLIRAGYVHKEMAGVHAFLPLGLRVLNKIMDIIREEMDAIGGQEVLLSSLQRKEVWEASGRWDDSVNDVWFKTRLHDGDKYHQGAELGLANTHEEVLTDMMRSLISSHRDLPAYVYQFQTKFRNELRAKSGIMRSREFIMKDLYSFSTNMIEHDKFYEIAKVAYHRIFDRLGLGDRTFLTFAGGGSFSKYSHEFQTLCEAGEDTIYLDKSKRLAVNEEVYNDEVLNDLGLKKAGLTQHKGAEVGNIFTLGTKYSEALGLHFTDEHGKTAPVFMGSYGIGPARCMGVIVETFADEKGLVWPRQMAPFDVHIVSLGAHDKKVRVAADDLYGALGKKGIAVLYDDRGDESAGTKLSDADLIGIPLRVVVSPRTLDKKKYELTERTTGKTHFIDTNDLIKLVKKHF